MKATTVSLLALFETKMQLEVPLFQRQYIWQQEKHWERSTGNLFGRISNVSLLTVLTVAKTPLFIFLVPWCWTLNKRRQRR